MSQPSSPHSPRRPGAPDPSSAPDAPADRRLLTPTERFGSDEPETAPTPDPFVTEPMATASRRVDEMARRHLPPHERRKHERAVKKRSKREATRGNATHRVSRDRVRHEERAQAEREFALHARHEPPVAGPKRRRMPLFWKRLLWVVAILFVGQLGFAAFTAPQFNIKYVAIEGADATPQEQLRPLAAKLIGQNWLRANRKAIETSVEALPTIASARIVRLPSWPPKVALSVVERQPILRVGAGNDWWVADQNGVPFRRPNAEDAGLYTVVAPQFSPRFRQKLNPKIWQDAYALNTALVDDNRQAAAEKGAAGSGEAAAGANGAQNNSFWQLRRIYFDRDGQASLRLTGKGVLASQNELLVRLGDERWSEKLARARVALTYFARTGRRAAELDLVSFEHPVWRSDPAQLAVDKDGESKALKTG